MLPGRAFTDKSIVIVFFYQMKHDYCGKHMNSAL